jgi:hypothetical protein
VRIADTVAANQHVDLVFEAAGHSLLATVRPRRLATGVTKEAGFLRLRDVVRVEGLMAGLYLSTAPWRDPVKQTVDADGVIEVPAQLRVAGSMAVALRVDDPWAPAPWPRWPSDSFHVVDAGYLHSEDEDETALSRFVAGLDDISDECRELGRVWKLLTLAPQLYRTSEANRIAERCADVLRRSPSRAIASLADVGASTGEIVEALVGSGVAASNTIADGEIAARLWPSAPLLGALSGARDDEYVREAALGQCGEALDGLLSAGIDPYAAVGRFGPEAQAMTAMQPQQLEGLWRAAQVVPKALLDSDSRLVAARRLFDHRADDGVWQIGSLASGIVRNAMSVLNGRVRLTTQITARRGACGAGDWLDLPAASAALAIIARLAARGDVSCQRTEQRYRAKWRRLAAGAPDLVTIDLILGELLVALEIQEH